MARRVLAFALSILSVAAAAGTGARASSADSIAGVPAEQVGIHGPTAHFLDGFELVGHAPIKPAGELRDGIGNNGAPALVGDCAYVGRWHDYAGSRKRPIQIVDVNESSPTFTQVVGSVPGSDLTGTTFRELRAVDLPSWRILVALTFSPSATDSGRSKFNGLRIWDATDCRNPVAIGFSDLFQHRPHEFFLWLDPDPAHDVNGHPRALAFVTTPITAPNLWVIDISDPALPRPAGAYDAAQVVASLEEAEGTYLGNYLHSVSVSDDGKLAYLSYWDSGFMTVDTSALAAGLPAAPVVPAGLATLPYDYSPPGVGNTHSAVPIADTNAVLIGDEVYATTNGCPYGWLRTADAGAAEAAPSGLGEMRLAENDPDNCIAVEGRAQKMVRFRNSAGAPVDGTFTMHNQTVTGRYAFVTWYGGGMRAVDLADPANPVEVGAFVPKPLDLVLNPSLTAAPTPFQGLTPSSEDDWWVETWSYPVVRDGLIYVTDIRNGLFILRPAPDAPFAAEVGATCFAEGNSNLGAIEG